MATAEHAKPGIPASYSVAQEARSTLTALASACRSQLPVPVAARLASLEESSDCGVTFTPSADNDEVCFPCPLKEQECGAALKALEGCVAAAITDLRSGNNQPTRKVEIDIGKLTCFLMSAYLTTLDGMGKGDTEIKSRIPGWSFPLYQDSLL